MATLSEEVKTFIVQRLAMFDTPTEVADAVKEAYDVVVDRRQVQMYDPERAGKKPAEQWGALYAATRAAFLNETAKVPAAHRAVRVKKLAGMLDWPTVKRNPVLVAQLLEQIAKEVGDAYTNRRVLTPEDPAEALARDLGMSAEELRKLAAGAASTTSSGDDS